MSSKKKEFLKADKDLESGNRKRRIVVFSSVIVLVLIAAVIVMIYQGQLAREEKPQKKQATHRTEQATGINYNGQPFIGSTNAPVKVVEFADYRCPYCKQFEDNVVPQLEKNYIETNKVSLYYINYTILGPGSLLAANAAEEVFRQNPKAFWAFHDALFKAQGDEKTEWVTKQLLTDIAKQTVPSLDLKAFQNALDTASNKNAVARDNQMAEELGVPGTPTVFVNGTMIDGAQDYAVLKQAIDQALNKK